MPLEVALRDHPQNVASWSACPACRLPLRGDRIVCATCGSIVPAERWGGRVRARAARALGGAAIRLSAVPADALLWVLAVLPLNVIAPVIAAGLAVARWRRPATGPTERRLLGMILAVCALNIVLSAYGLVMLAAHFDALVTDVTRWLGEWPLGRRQPAFRYI